MNVETVERTHKTDMKVHIREFGDPKVQNSVWRNFFNKAQYVVRPLGNMNIFMMSACLYSFKKSFILLASNTGLNELKEEDNSAYAVRRSMSTTRSVADLSNPLYSTDPTPSPADLTLQVGY